MKNKGFTLVELLAVIAILAVLVIIALPNIMSLFNESKKNSFTTELKQIHGAAQQQWMNDSMFDTKEVTYARCNNDECPNQLQMSGRQQLEYYIKLNKAGNVTEFYATDGTYQYSYSGEDLKVENISGVIQIARITDDEKVNISCSGASEGPRQVCIFHDMPGSELYFFPYVASSDWDEFYNKSSASDKAILHDIWYGSLGHVEVQTGIISSKCFLQDGNNPQYCYINGTYLGNPTEQTLKSGNYYGAWFGNILDSSVACYCYID